MPAGNAWAAGYTAGRNGLDPETLIEYWNGTAWK
jgi:hypothetical protein